MRKFAASFISFPGPQKFLVDGADFDGTNDYMTRGAGLTGAVDTKTGILSIWLRIDAGNGTARRILANTGDFVQIYLGTDNNIYVYLIEPGGPNEVLLLGTVSGGLTSGASWRHILASWDIVASATHMYLDDISDKQVPILLNLAPDYTVADWRVGATMAAGAKYNGCMAEFYFAPNQFLDFSVEANRRKYRTAVGKPALLGLDGSLPTGVAPIMYHHLDDNEAVANFATNRGSGGNFTITGTLDTATTSPTD